MNVLTCDEIAVRKLHDEVIAAVNAADVEILLSLHTEDIIVMEPGMPLIRGRKEMRKLFDKFIKQKLSLRLAFNICEIIVFGERAFVRGQVFKTTGNKPGYEAGKFVTLSQKQSNGCWLRTHVIANNDLPVEEESFCRPVKLSMGIKDILWNQ